MIRRRDFVRAFGLGAAGTLLGPLVRRLVAEARGDATDARLLFVLTDGNGWGHQGQPRDPENLDCDLRSATDWDLPAVLEPLAPVRSKVTILRNLYNPHGRNLHGNGWGTLTVAPTDGRNPGGVSLDRFVGHELGREDAFRSIALGVATRPDRAAVSTSADGPSRPFPAIASPTRAFATFFGSAESPDRAIASLAEGRSVLDAVHEDTTRLASRLAGPERSKLDQMLGALRELENQLGERVRVLSERGVPDIDLSDEGTLSAETVRAHVEIAARAFAFGLTRVAHLSVLGLDAHNVGWGFLGFGGDAHESVAHVSGGYDRARATAAYQAIQRFKATELAHLFGLLAAERVGDESLADRAVGIWVNSGGGKHHDGTSTIPLVVVGDAGGAMRTGLYHRYEGRVCVSRAFLSVARAVGSSATVFGDPEHCPGPLDELAR